MPELDKKIVVTGGGSGGHTNTAIAFIEALENKYTNALDKVLYIGGDLAMEGEKGKSIEEKILKKTEIKYKIIRAGKLQRYFNLQTIRLLFRSIGGLIDSFRVLKKNKPDLIFSTGGYVTTPVCISAWILKIPIYIHEQTINAGLANRISGKFADKIFITFPQSKEHFSTNKVVHTGNIIKKDVLKEKKSGEIAEVIKNMKKNKEKQPIIYISGGSQGSHIINATIREMLDYLVQHYQIILQTGDNTIHNDYKKLNRDRQKLPKSKQDSFYPIKYINSSEVGTVYNNMDLFIGRAGANTIYEIGLLQKKSILIPIPWVNKNEQYHNARVLENLGLTKIIPEGELISDTLFDEINKMLNKEIKVKKEDIEECFPKNSIKKIFKEIGI